MSPRRTAAVKCLGSCGFMLRPIHRTEGEYAGTRKVYQDQRCKACWIELNGAPPPAMVDFEARQVKTRATLEKGARAGIKARATIEAERRRRGLAPGTQAPRAAPQLRRQIYGPGMPLPPIPPNAYAHLRPSKSPDQNNQGA